MSPVATWEEKKDVYSQLQWRELSNGIGMSAFMRMRYLPPGVAPRVQVMLRNLGEKPIGSKVFMGVDTNKVKECVYTNPEKIDPGYVWWGIYNVPIKKRKHQKVGTHNVGAFVELHNAKHYAGKAARIALGALTGFAPGGKIHGMSLGFKVINQIPCPNCKIPMNFQKNADDVPFWNCPQCQKQFYD